MPKLKVISYFILNFPYNTRHSKVRRIRACALPPDFQIQFPLLPECFDLNFLHLR